MFEIWKKIKEYPRYEVSNIGRVRSLFYANKYGVFKRKEPMILVLVKGNNNGMYSVTLCNGTVNRAILINRLVLKTFDPIKEYKHLQAEHLNGDRTDNRIQNLRWATVQENNKRKFEHGTVLMGEDHPRAKLTNEDVITIRRSHRLGVKSVVLAKLYKVKPASISGIIRRTSWKNI